MTQRIIYNEASGDLSIIIPAAECGLTIEEIALKDVPEGLPYKIVNTLDIIQDRTFRDAWEIDVNTLTDGVGAPDIV